MERCPHCNSTSTKTLPMIYGSGSSTSSSTWITSRGRVGSRSGSRQTRLAAAAAPPRAPSIALGFIGMLIVSGIVWIVLANLIAPVAKLISNATQAAVFSKVAPVLMLGVMARHFLRLDNSASRKNEAVFATARRVGTDMDVSEMRHYLDMTRHFQNT